MKFVFLTNQASYHQMHFARAMVALIGAEQFRMVFQKPTSDARAEMGWVDDYTESYVLRFWHEDQQQQALQWIDDADVVIQGRFPIRYVRQRIRNGKLTFACQERLWKRPPSLGRKISRLPHLIKNYYSVNKDNYHFLAIGAFAAADLNELGIFRGRSWQYGYFMDVPPYSPRTQQSEQVSLLWCARFSPVKQPIRALEVLAGLRERGLDAHLTMIGDGELKAEMMQQVVDRDLTSFTQFTGWLSNSEVVQYMRQSDLFLMTSHHGEGWGMVVNEAMANGAAVMADQRLGAATCLIGSGDGGYLYTDASFNQVLDEIANEGRADILATGKRGHAVLSDQWSSEQAAIRTVALSEKLLAADVQAAQKLFTTGPCAPIAG